MLHFKLGKEMYRRENEIQYFCKGKSQVLKRVFLENRPGILICVTFQLIRDISLRFLSQKKAKQTPRSLQHSKGSSLTTLRAPDYEKPVRMACEGKNFMAVYNIKSFVYIDRFSLMQTAPYITNMLTSFRILMPALQDTLRGATTLTPTKCYCSRVHSLLHVELLLLQCYVDITDVF